MRAALCIFCCLVLLFGVRPSLVVTYLPDNFKHVFDPRANRFLESMDYILEQEPGKGTIEDNGRAPLTETERACLHEKGFLPVAQVGLGHGSDSGLMSRLRELVWASEYPEYTVWKNQRKTTKQ